MHSYEPLNTDEKVLDDRLEPIYNTSVPRQNVVKKVSWNGGTIEMNSKREVGCWLFGFYVISTFVGYLMLNPFLCKLSVLFQTIQLSMSTQFNFQKHIYFKLFSLLKQF